MPNLGVIFLTGLLAGGITCMAVQGGLLASTVVAKKKDDTQSLGREDVGLVGSFLGGKLVSHLILGALLGAVGSVVSISIKLQIIMQIVVVIYMLGVAGAMLEIHPVFRHFLIQTPRFLGRLVRKTSKSDKWFAPALLGFLTVVIPCGTTQAMMAVALGTGNPLWGALVLGTFVIGTSPLFMILGLSIAKFGDVFKQKFAKVAAYLLVVAALWNLNGALVLAGSPVTAKRILARVECAISFCEPEVLADVDTPTQSVTIRMTRNGYKVDQGTIKSGTEINLELVNTDGAGCIQAFTIPSLGIQKIVGVGESQRISFVAPDKPGVLNFSCSMGMYEGRLRVI